MTNTLPEKLADYKPSGREYKGTRVLLGIDSDGCVDNGMIVKHRGPFPQAGIFTYGFGPIEKQWRIAWSYVNEIQDRGCPRFQALPMAMDRVGEMPVVQKLVQEGRVHIPKLSHLRKYLQEIAATKGYGDNVLNEYVATLPKGEERYELLKIQLWSRTVNHNVEHNCPPITPFPEAITAIKTADGYGMDIMIVSGTPEAHLRKSWGGYGLLDHVRGVFGRDSGKKQDHLVAAIKAGEAAGIPYDYVMMIGDAPGDDKERKKASAKRFGSPIRFFPIEAGHEDQNWRWFNETFLATKGNLMSYDSLLEKQRLDSFYANLNRPWKPNATSIEELFQ